MRPYRDSRLIRTILVLFFIALLAYAAFEAKGILYGPVIHVPSGAITVYEASTLIKGNTERITELRLNGKTIPVTEGGAFEELHLLAPGSNRLFLEAQDAQGRKTKKVLDIIYIPRGTTATASTTTPQGGGDEM